MKFYCPGQKLVAQWSGAVLTIKRVCYACDLLKVDYGCGNAPTPYAILESQSKYRLLAVFTNNRYDCFAFMDKYCTPVVE